MQKYIKALSLRLEVYNLLGQKVITLFNGDMLAGITT